MRASMQTAMAPSRKPVVTANGHVLTGLHASVLCRLVCVGHQDVSALTLADVRNGVGVTAYIAMLFVDRGFAVEGNGGRIEPTDLARGIVDHLGPPFTTEGQQARARAEAEAEALRLAEEAELRRQEAEQHARAATWDEAWRLAGIWRRREQRAAEIRRRRDAGETWAEVGAALGISKQRAWQFVKDWDA